LQRRNDPKARDVFKTGFFFGSAIGELEIG